MPVIGPNNFLVELLHAKTKIKKDDILDVLKFLPECMAEAFLEANRPEKKTISFGCIYVHWKKGGLGPQVIFKATDAFKNHFRRLQIEGKYPLAVQLYQMQLPTSQKLMQEKAAKGRYLKPSILPKKHKKTAESTKKMRDHRIKMKENRKKQGIILDTLQDN